MPAAPTRIVTQSNAQFQKAVKRLPLGVSSTFRYWGDGGTIYVHHGKGGIQGTFYETVAYHLHDLGIIVEPGITGAAGWNAAERILEAT